MQLIKSQKKDDCETIIIRIYQKVLLQMFQDLTARSKNIYFSAYRNQAFEWFFSSKYKKDFDEVCELAGFNPVNIKNKAKKILDDAGGLFNPQTTAKK